MRILYVHGYNGDPYGSSFSHLKKAAGASHELYSVDYKAEDPRAAIELIRQAAMFHEIDVIIGASLGGFLAMHIFGFSRIIVNPCWDPANELPHVGYTGDTALYSTLLEQFKENTDFEEKNLCSVCIAPHDEHLGERYRDILENHFHNVYEISGGHRICEVSADEIINNFLPIHEENVRTFVKQLKGMDNLPIWEM